MFVSSLIISDIPVTPPSINEFGNRNPFRPKLAEMIPKAMKLISRTSFQNSLELYFCFTDVFFFNCFTIFTFIFHSKAKITEVFSVLRIFKKAGLLK